VGWCRPLLLVPPRLYLALGGWLSAPPSSTCEYIPRIASSYLERLQFSHRKRVSTPPMRGPAACCCSGAPGSPGRFCALGGSWVALAIRVALHERFLAMKSGFMLASFEICSPGGIRPYNAMPFSRPIRGVSWSVFLDLTHMGSAQLVPRGRAYVCGESLPVSWFLQGFTLVPCTRPHDGVAGISWAVRCLCAIHGATVEHAV